MDSPKPALKQRIWELDFIRGLCVLLMVLDHVLYDLGFIFWQQWFPDGGTGLLYQLCQIAHDLYWPWAVRKILRFLVLAGFIGLCGLSCSFSHSNLKRGLKLLLVAFLLTAVTAAMDYLYGYRDFFIIRCGVLHMLAVGILIYSLLQHGNQWAILIIGLSLTIGGAYFSAYPISSEGLLPFILGIGGGSYSADYFPLLPWVGYFLLGAFLGKKLLYKEKRSYFPHRGQGKGLRTIQFIGRHALIIYLVHQPLVYAILWLLGKLL